MRLSQKDLPIELQPAGISIDLAIVVDESVTAEQLVQRLKSAGGKLTATSDSLTCTAMPCVLEVKKSMAFSLTYRADDERLLQKEVEDLTKACGEGSSFYQRRNSRINGIVVPSWNIITYCSC